MFQVFKMQTFGDGTGAAGLWAKLTCWKVRLCQGHIELPVLLQEAGKEQAPRFLVLAGDGGEAGDGHR